MKKLLFVFLLTSITIYGQQIKGVVVDEVSNKPIANVNVYVKTIAEGTTTDTLGEFSIRVNKTFNKKDSISFSYIGYVTKYYPLANFKTGEITVRLRPNMELLKEVSVTINRKLNHSLAYTELASTKKAVHSFGSILVDGKIYIIGGDKSYIENHSMRALDEENLNGLFKKINPSWEKFDGSLKVYHIEKDKWEYSDLKFRERAYHNLNYFEGKIYILGGKRLSRNRKLEYLDDKIERFDIESNTIFIDNSNPHQAINAASFVYNNKLIVLGGSVKLKASGTKVYTNKTHVYNSESGYWYELNHMPIAKEAKGILVENKYYLIGGYKDNVLNSIETLDLISGKWKRIGKLFNRMERPGLATDGATIYIFDDGVFITINTKTNEMNQYHINLRLKSPEMYYYKNKLYVIGGYTPSNFKKTPSSKVFCIDLEEVKNKKKKTRK